MNKQYKQKITAMLLLLPLLFPSCSAAWEEQTEGQRQNETCLSSAEEPEKESACDFALPQFIELEPGERLTPVLPTDAEIKSMDESILAVTASGLLAGEEGKTTLTVEANGVRKEAEVSVIRFEEPESEPEADLPGGKYHLVVNKTRNYIVVYDLKDEEREHPLKAMICSTGTATPDKTYRIGSRKVWNRLYGNVWGKYATVIRGDILFHSVPYAQKDSGTLIGAYYNQLGTAASMGCVRLRVCDAKWIYDCCETGTRITFVKEDVDPPIPYEIPLHLPDGYTWDPTDTEEGNPWSEKEPLIVAENHVIGKDTAFDPLEYVRVYDIAGNDVTAEARIEGNIQTACTGRYLLHIAYEDGFGNRVSKTVRITVMEGKRK